MQHSPRPIIMQPRSYLHFGLYTSLGDGRCSYLLRPHRLALLDLQIGHISPPQYTPQRLIRNYNLVALQSCRRDAGGTPL